MAEIANNTSMSPSIRPSKRPRDPIITAYLMVMFAAPFCSGSPFHVLFVLTWMVLFIVYVFIQTKRMPLSLFSELKTYHPTIFYLLISFAVSSLISYLLVMFDDVGMKHKAFATIRYFVDWLLLAYTLSLTRFCLINEVSHSKIFLGYVYGTMVLVGILLAIYYWGDAPNAARWSIEPPLGEHVRLMGIVASVSVIVSVILFLLNEFHSMIFQGVLWLCTLIASAFLIWTGSRASMILVLVTICFLLALSRIILKIKYYKIIGLIFAVGFSFVVAEKFSIFEWNGLGRAVQVSTAVETRIENTNVEMNQQQQAEEVTSGRLSMWTVTIKAIKTAPWFGLGPYGYFFIKDRTNQFDHPHNFILQFIVEWGLIGATLLLALLGYLLLIGLKKLPRAFREKNTDYVIAATVIILLSLNGLVDGTFFLMQPLLCLTTAFAIFPFYDAVDKYHVKALVDHV